VPGPRSSGAGCQDAGRKQEPVRQTGIGPSVCLPGPSGLGGPFTGHLQGLFGVTRFILVEIGEQDQRKNLLCWNEFILISA